MTRSDIQTIWSKIKELHPHTPKDKIPRLTADVADMWIGWLQGYDLDTVIAAVVSQRKKKPFWPDIDEIMAELPPLKDYGAHTDTNRKNRKKDPFLERYRESWNDCKVRRKALGVPVDIEEARKMGMSGFEIWETWERLGLIPEVKADGT